MTIPRSRKKKKPDRERPAKSPLEIVRLTNKVTLSIACMTLANVLELSEEQIGEFINGYTAFLEEIADGRNSTFQAIEDCDKMIGFNISEIINDLFSEAEKTKKGRKLK